MAGLTPADWQEAPLPTVADFKAGKDSAKMAIVGAVMKANKGVPNDVVRRLVDEELAKG